MGGGGGSKFVNERTILLAYKLCYDVISCYINKMSLFKKSLSGIDLSMSYILSF